MMVAGTVAGFARTAHAEDFCENWANYIWDFDKQNEASVDSTWSELNAMNLKLAKGRRIAAVGSVSKAEALPFPSIPSAVESELDAQTQAKVRGLYERYILLGRRIDDEWKDKFKNNESPTSMQRFASARDQLVSEMNKMAKTAKTEFVRYGLRNKDCFAEYEATAKKQIQALNQALASASSALKVDDGVWAHAFEDNAPPAQEVPMVSARKPASAPASGGTEPAIVPESGTESTSKKQQ